MPFERAPADASDLTPIKCLHAIADLFGEGIRRARAESGGRGAPRPHQQRESARLEPLEPVGLDRPRPRAVSPRAETESPRCRTRLPRWRPARSNGRRSPSPRRRSGSGTPRPRARSPRRASEPAPPSPCSGGAGRCRGSRTGRPRGRARSPRSRPRAPCCRISASLAQLARRGTIRHRESSGQSAASGHTR